MLKRITTARVLAVLLLVLVAVPVFLSPASAAPLVAITAVAPTGEAVAIAFTLDPAAVVQLFLSVVMPVVVGLITTRVTAAGTKAWLLAASTLATSLLVELGRVLVAGGVYDVGAALLLALPAFVVSVATHYGLWKPTGIAAAAQDVGAKHRA